MPEKYFGILLVHAHFDCDVIDNSGAISQHYVMKSGTAICECAPK